MEEAKFVLPRKCPNCGCGGRKITITKDFRDAKDVANPNNDFDCPKCGDGFCGKCFVPDFKGSGKTWHCPHCKELLGIPVGIQYQPHEMN